MQSDHARTAVHGIVSLVALSPSAVVLSLAASHLSPHTSAKTLLSLILAMLAGGITFHAPGVSMCDGSCSNICASANPLFFLQKELWGEAASRIAEVVNDEMFRSLEGKSRHGLWLELADICTRHPAAVSHLRVEAILRAGIRKFTDEARHADSLQSL